MYTKGPPPPAQPSPSSSSFKNVHLLWCHWFFFFFFSIDGWSISNQKNPRVSPPLNACDRYRKNTCVWVCNITLALCNSEAATHLHVSAPTHARTEKKTLLIDYRWESIPWGEQNLVKKAEQRYRTNETQHLRRPPSYLEANTVLMFVVAFFLSLSIANKQLGPSLPLLVQHCPKGFLLSFFPSFVCFLPLNMTHNDSNKIRVWVCDLRCAQMFPSKWNFNVLFFFSFLFFLALLCNWLLFLCMCAPVRANWEGEKKSDSHEGRRDSVIKGANL